MPPSTSPASCSANSACASASVRVPSGSISSPVGPRSPATSSPRSSATPRARRAAASVELVHPVAEAVQVQPRAGAPEGVGGEHRRPRLGVLPVRGADRVRVLGVPELAGDAALEAAVLQQGAHAAVEEPAGQRGCRGLTTPPGRPGARAASARRAGVDPVAGEDQGLDVVEHVPDVDRHPRGDPPVAEPEGDELPAARSPRTTTSSSGAPSPTYSMPRSYWSV